MNRSLSRHKGLGSLVRRAVTLLVAAVLVLSSGAFIGTVSAAAAAKAPAKPTAKLAAPKTVTVGGLVTVRTKGSKAPAHLKSVVLSFGDKTPKLHSTKLFAVKSHRYKKPGRYTVTLKLTDVKNRVARVHRFITVKKLVVKQPPIGSSHGTGAQPPATTFTPPAGLAGGDTLPASADLTANAVPVQNQGKIQSCVAWAIDYAMLGWYSNAQNIAGKPFAPMYTYSQISKGQNVPTSAVEALNLGKTQGNDTVADYGSGSYADYVNQPTAAQRANAANYQIANWETVTSSATGSVGAAGALLIKAKLAAGMPVAFGMFLPVSLETFSGAGVFSDLSKNFNGGHEMLALGYDANGILVQNSWGTDWGNQGFATLSWDVVAQDVDEAVTITGLVPAAAQTDTVAPSATAPAQTMAVRTSFGAIGVPVTVSWSGSDNNGVAGYDLYANTNGSGWYVQTLPSAAATSIQYQLIAGTSYQFAVRARDAAGNLSDWAYGNAFTVQDYAETDPSLSYSAGGWSYQAYGDADGGQQATSATTAATVSFTFVGRNVAWVTTRAANRGQANVYIDSTFVGTVDLYSATPVSRSIAAVLNAETQGTHSIVIQVVGTVGRPDVDLDSFIVLQ